MNLEVYKKFEEILSNSHITGKVLEVGAIPSKKSLLASKYLKTAKVKLGLNLNGPSEFNDFKIIKGNANNMQMFNDEEFDCVLCNATLEHDKFFWKSVAEMKRVLKKNGLLVIGTPSYTQLEIKKGILLKIIKILLDRIFLLDMLINSTFTYKIHDAPGDYYRFSEQTFKEIFFRGFKDVKIQTILIPPRTIAYGFKKDI